MIRNEDRASEPVPVRNAEQLRALYPEPRGRSLRKVIDHLDHHCQQFLGLSPFCVLASASENAEPEISPRGGSPGFARVLDERTLLMPDRPGNNRLDNFCNITANPAVALLFLVPGIDETLRVYGEASILRPEELPSAMTADGKTRAGLRVDVARVHFQCPKALMRARVWRADHQVERSRFPTLGQILAEQTGDTGEPESQRAMLRRYRDLL